MKSEIINGVEFTHAKHDIVCLLRDCGYKYKPEANWERQAARAEKQYKQATRDVIDFITNHLWNR